MVKNGFYGNGDLDLVRDGKKVRQIAVFSTYYFHRYLYELTLLISWLIVQMLPALFSISVTLIGIYMN